LLDGVVGHFVMGKNAPNHITEFFPRGPRRANALSGSIKCVTFGDNVKRAWFPPFLRPSPDSFGIHPRGVMTFLPAYFRFPKDR